MKIDGRCHCGAITYEAEVDPAFVSICHCTDCQTLTGTAFRTSIRAAHDKFKLLSGTPKVYVKIGDSGGRRAQAFCADCGSPIYATAAEGNAPYNIRVGTVRQRSELVPMVQIWCRSEQQWLPTLGGIRKVEKQA
jgi:hypothetical protein